MEAIQAEAKKFIDNSKNEIVNTKHLEWGIMGGLSLFMNMFVWMIVKSKEDSTITFSLIFYTLLLTVLSVLVRQHAQPANRYSYCVVALTVMAMGIRLSPFSILLLAGVPLLLNFAREKLKSS
eukprot:TRINITY_DN6311_c0_g1_i1.p1 TRINITY_DN6311_c0_g1~~TRINITY_DN6311_c0_g1_i1.p1  ORF type:complete len:142 (-),score=30.75 TRINITY_DN6311_c0_g1_i1:237-605(-)